MIKGRFFDGCSSTAVAAELHIGVDGMVRVTGLPQPRCQALAEVSISDRIGAIPRRIVFADGASFETTDNDAIDASLAALGRQGGFMRKVAQWERAWPVAIGALLAIVVCSWLLVQFGLPMLARQAARALPAEVDEAIGAQGLQILDRSMLAPSTLDEARQRELRRRFDAIVESQQDEHRYMLEFRSGNRIGANAFALPSGIIVITDELIDLAEDDEEIVAVLAHEVGHVRQRHALRMLLQSAGVSALAVAVLGDISSGSALAAAIPTMLVNAKHSREFEEEADDFAYRWLDAQGISRERFGSLLRRLEAKSGRGDGEVMSWLSSHPPTKKRVRK